MSNDIWIGALISVPIGVGTGLSVAPLQRWLEDRGKAKAVAQNSRMQKQYEEVLFYKLHSHLFTQHLLHVTIRVAFVGAAVGIISGFMFALGQLRLETTPIWQLAGTWSVGLTDIFFFAGQVVTIGSSLLVIGYCRPALLLWQRVRNFDEYANNVPQGIRHDNTEKTIAEGANSA